LWTLTAILPKNWSVARNPSRFIRPALKNSTKDLLKAAAETSTVREKSTGALEGAGYE
jgi:hypothetical protein